MASTISENETLICQDPHSFGHLPIWASGNPLESPTSLFFLQVSLITVITQFLHVCLQPLGQPTVVSQLLGGLVLGPSILGGSKTLLVRTLFPIRSFVVLETAASFSILIFYFVMSAKMDPFTLLKTEKQAVAVGLSVFFLTAGIPTAMTLILIKIVPMEEDFAKGLMIITVSQSFTVIISIAVLVTELKILNTDIGRLALSAAMFADVVGFGLAVFMVAFTQDVHGSSLARLWILLSIMALFILIFYVIRPATIWMIKHLDGKPIDEIRLVFLILSVLAIGFISDSIGQHFPMGAIILGLAVPAGPPLGSTLTNRLETFTGTFLYPVYLAICGQKTDIFKISPQSIWIVTLIVVVAFFVKIGAVMLPGYFTNIPMKNCFIIGLILNGRGIGEISLYNLWRQSKMLTDEEFSLMVISILVVNAIIAPLIKIMYNPATQYNTGKRCTVQHNKRDSELRVMVCVYGNENITTMLNIVEASCATMESTVTATALLLVELTGRARPVLVAHQPHWRLRHTPCMSTRLDNTLKQYAQQNEGCAFIQSFTSISDLETISDDACKISVDAQANILIMPFHKQWEIDGTVHVTNSKIRIMNLKVLERAPCSVGILIDRGILNGSPSLMMAKATFYIAVFFIGGCDDAEALAYASRMSRHECVSVTVVRFLVFGEENSKERRRDSDLVNEYRHQNSGNQSFEVIDEVVKNGIEMSSCIRKSIDYFDLVMVGREHPPSQSSVLLQGHEKWSECPELGTIGDMLASQDFVTKASVLVVQQQRIGGRFGKHLLSLMGPNHRDQLVHDVPINDTPRGSCVISMDNKY